MHSNSSINPYGFDSREALRDTNPEMRGAFDVARQRQETTRRGIMNLSRAIGIFPPSPEVHQQALTNDKQALVRHQDAERQAVMVEGAREQLKAMPDSTPRIEIDSIPDNVNQIPQSDSEHVSKINQIADNRYNGGLSRIS